MLDVRGLAAADMHGRSGTRRRRTIIRAEFVLGAAACPALGVLALLSGDPVQVALGAWLCGVGVNYVPLALHAIALARPGALEREMSGRDPAEQLRRATREQLWIAVPLAVALAAIRQRRPES